MPVLKKASVDLYYEVEGSGAPILFIQGVGVAGEGWRPQVIGLKNHFRTLLFDNRGLGRSVPCRGPITIEAMAEDAQDLLDAVGWDSAHVVGHSMGGIIAQQLALDCPKRVRSLSLLCTFARGKEAARLTPWVIWMTLRTRLGTRRMRRRAFLEMLIPPADLKETELDQMASDIAALIGRDLAEQPPILLKQLRALSRHDRLGQLGQLQNIPTLVMSGDQDRIALSQYGRTLAASIAGAQFEEIRAAAHGLTIQHAPFVNQRLTRFITSADGKSA